MTRIINSLFYCKTCMQTDFSANTIFYLFRTKSLANKYAFNTQIFPTMFIYIYICIILKPFEYKYKRTQHILYKQKKFLFVSSVNTLSCCPDISLVISTCFFHRKNLYTLIFAVICCLPHFHISIMNPRHNSIYILPNYNIFYLTSILLLLIIYTFLQH